MTADTLAVATPKTVTVISRTTSGQSASLRDQDEPAQRLPHTGDDTHVRTMAGQMLQMVRAAGRTQLNPSEIEQLLTVYGISAVGVQYATGLDQRDDDSLGADERSPGITQRDARKDSGYELIIGSHVDRQCGPVLSLRAGRPLPNVFQNRALALPPLTTTMARHMMERTGIAATITGTDDRIEYNLGELDQLLVRVSQLIAEQRLIKELLLMLLVVPPEGLLIHDAQVSVYDAAVQTEELPALAGRLYPAQYVAKWLLKDGTPVTIRPIRPEDEPLMIRFHETLSEQTVEMRYFGPQKLSQRIAPEELLHLRCIDYDREMVLVVERRDPTTGDRVFLGLGCLIKLGHSNDAEIALLVGDAWQGQGIGSELLCWLIQIGRDKGLARIIGEVLPDNQVALRILPRFGFQLHRSISEPVQVVLDL